MNENVDVERVTYDTKDFNLAAFLWCQVGVDLVDHAPRDVTRPREIYFTFEFEDRDNSAVDTLVKKYMNGKCQVEPSVFVQAQTRLKHIIHTA